MQWKNRDVSTVSDRELFLDDGTPFRFVVERDEDIDTTVATASVGWARDLFPEKQRAKSRDLRLEASLDYSWFDVSTSPGEFEPSPFVALFEPDPELQFTLSLAFRNRWSVVRLGLGYREGGER